MHGEKSNNRKSGSDRGIIRCYWLLLIFVYLVQVHWSASARSESEDNISASKKVDSDSSANYLFQPAVRLPAATAAHTATVLTNGDVLVVGGYGRVFGRIPLVSTLVSLFDHEQLKWRIVTGRLNYGRLSHGAVRLADGKVLIAGGVGQDKKQVRSLELYDPLTEQFEILPNMSVGRKRPCLNLLSEGRVLITGREKQADILLPSKTSSSGFVVRPSIGKSMVKHSQHVTISLQDGSVLLFGGRNTLIERFDPNSETFRRCRSRLPKVYDDQTATLLYDGKVLLAGGQEVYSNRCVNQTWLYDPVADVLIEGPRLNPGFAGASELGVSDMAAVDLFGHEPNGRGRYILLCGGEYDPGNDGGADVVLDSAWVYDAQKSQLIEVGPMLNAHDDFAAALLPWQSGTVRALIIAGHGPHDSLQANCEIFHWRYNEDSHSP